MQKIVIVHESNLSVPALFDLLADHNQLQKIFGLPVRRVQDGAGEINGVGSVRRLGFFGPLSVDETVTAMEPGRSIDYRISRGGFPIRNHRGRLDFADAGPGSRVTWTIEFDSALPLAAQALKLVLGQAIRSGLQRAA